MPDVLLYQTFDPDFAERAVEALTKAGIASRHSGTAFAALYSGQMGDLGREVCVFIEHESDYCHANEILIKLGAAIDTPTKLPSRAVVLGIAITLGIVIALLVASNWK